MSKQQYERVNWKSGTLVTPAKVLADNTIQEAVYDCDTPLTPENLNKMDSGIKTLDDNKIEIIELLTVSDVAPTECATGDMYYNTTTNKIYTATNVNTWGETGTDPESNNLYIDLEHTNIYYYDGTLFKSYGGGTGGGDTEPIGSTKMYFGTTEPNGYKFANGQAISRTEYAELFKIIGTTYGEGDGSTTFNLPNMNGRVPVGLNVNKEWFNQLGKTGGSEEVTLTIDEMPSHTHSVLVSGGGNKYAASFTQDGGTLEYIPTSSKGEGQPHNNLQPYITVNYIMKVKNISTLPQTAELIGTDGTPSDTNTYHANAINELLNNEVTLLEGKLLGGKTISKDFAPYKRLLITFSMYDRPDETENNGGTSGIAILDLTTNVNQMYSVCGQIPYNMLSSNAAGNEMGYFLRVNKEKNEFYCRFHYKGDYQDNNQYYYVSKIVGIK